MICEPRDTAGLVELVALGVTGLVGTDQTPQELAEAVLELAAGGAELPPDVVAAVVADWRRGRRRGAGDTRSAELTARERDVLDAISDGLSAKAVAHHLGIAVKTVEHHKSRIFDKLGVRTQAEAVAVALGTADEPDEADETHEADEADETRRDPRDPRGRQDRRGRRRGRRGRRRQRSVGVMIRRLPRKPKYASVPTDYGIDVRSMTKALRGRLILDRVDLEVRRGTLAVLEGSNGAGKTTLIRSLATVVAPDSGTVLVNGYDVVRQSLDVRRSIGVSFANERSLYWRINAFENLELFGKIAGLAKPAIAKRSVDLLEQLRLIGCLDTAGGPPVHRPAAAADGRQGLPHRSGRGAARRAVPGYRRGRTALDHRPGDRPGRPWHHGAHRGTADRRHRACGGQDLPDPGRTDMADPGRRRRSAPGVQGERTGFRVPGRDGGNQGADGTAASADAAEPDGRLPQTGGRVGEYP